MHDVTLGLEVESLEKKRKMRILSHDIVIQIQVVTPKNINVPTQDVDVHESKKYDEDVGK